VKNCISLVLLICTILLSFQIFTSADGTSLNPVTYKTEVRVKLLPSSPFSLKLTGEYEIVNLDQNEHIPYNSTISLTQKDGKVLLNSDGKTFSSIKGFVINEMSLSDNHQIEVSNINTANGLNPTAYRGSMEIKPGALSPDLFNKLDIENYIRGVVPAEMPASWEIEALKAQAVAARSYAYTQLQRNKQKGYLEMTVSNQVYGGKTREHPNSNQAVQLTEGIYALYNNIPIDAVFHSSSGGYTENSENVWKYPVPYIRAVDDPYDNNNENHHYAWQTVSSADKIKEKLGLLATQTILGLSITERGPSKAAKQVEATIYDSSTQAKSTFSLLPKYGTTSDSFRWLFGVSLKSIKFDISGDSSVNIRTSDGSDTTTQYLKGMKIKRADGTDSIIEDLNLGVKTNGSTVLTATSPKTFTFTGNGWGHLLGMSQWGARGMAEQGYTYEQILKHYYTGVEVKRLN
jgi:stage II sporulation protein D